MISCWKYRPRLVYSCRRQFDAEVTMPSFDADCEGSKPARVLLFYYVPQTRILCIFVITTKPTLFNTFQCHLIWIRICPENIVNGFERSNREISTSYMSPFKIKNPLASLSIQHKLCIISNSTLIQKHKIDLIRDQA